MSERTLDDEIADQEAKLQRLKARKDRQGGPWPKRVTIAVHGSKESNYERGEELGLVGEALRNFTYTAYEVILVYEVTQDGEATLVAVDGRPLGEKMS